VNIQIVNGGGRPNGYEDEEGKVTSVTTYLGQLQYPRALMKWAYKLGFEDGAELSPLDDAPGLDSHNEALSIGSASHGMIEDTILNIGDPFANKDLVRLDADEHREYAINSYAGWKAWEQEYTPEFIAIEKPLYGMMRVEGIEELIRFAGTFDAIARIDGHLHLIDWKTSKQISDSTFAQMGAYALLLALNEDFCEKIGVQELDYLSVVRLDKTGKGWEMKSTQDIIGCVEAFKSGIRHIHLKRKINKASDRSKGKVSTHI